MKTCFVYVTAAAICCIPAKAQAPDIVLYNGRIFTSRADQPWTEAIAIHGERVSAIGSTESIRRLAAAQTRLIDLDGKTVVPGFNDAHWHQGLRTSEEM